MRPQKLLCVVTTRAGKIKEIFSISQFFGVKDSTSALKGLSTFTLTEGSGYNYAEYAELNKPREFARAGLFALSSDTKSKGVGGIIRPLFFMAPTRVTVVRQGDYSRQPISLTASTMKDLNTFTFVKNGRPVKVDAQAYVRIATAIQIRLTYNSATDKITAGQIANKGITWRAEDDTTNVNFGMIREPLWDDIQIHITPARHAQDTVNSHFEQNNALLVADRFQNFLGGIEIVDDARGNPQRGANYTVADKIVMPPPGPHSGDRTPAAAQVKAVTTTNKKSLILSGKDKEVELNMEAGNARTLIEAASLKNTENLEIADPV